MTSAGKNTIDASYRRIASEKSVILLIPIDNEEVFHPFLTADEMEKLGKFSSPRRRAEWGAWRAAVRQELGDVGISYNSAGAPVIISETEKPLYLGVSHTKGMAAVILSENPCSIDIENLDRNFARSSSKYISDQEFSLPEAGSGLFMPLVWCAKEALYKLSGREGLDFLRDLKIRDTDTAGGNLRGAIRSEEGKWEEYLMRIMLVENYIVVYVVS